MKFCRPVMTVVFGLGLMATPVAAQKAPGRADAVASKLIKLDRGLRSARSHVSEVLEALSALTAAPDAELAVRYRTFAKAVSKTDQMYKAMKKQALAAKAGREKYLKQWDKDASKIQDPTLREASASSRAELEPIVSRIRDSFAIAEANIPPFLSGLKDLSLFLGNNLSSKGIATVEAMKATCDTNGTRVDSGLADASEAVRELALRLRPGLKS